MKKNLEFGGLLPLVPQKYRNFDPPIARPRHLDMFCRKNQTPIYYGFSKPLSTGGVPVNFENLLKYLPRRTP